MAQKKWTQRRAKSTLGPPQIFSFSTFSESPYCAIPPAIAREHAKWRCDTPPHQRGISAILARYPMKTRRNACDTPTCDTISTGYCAILGGISHWAAKGIWCASSNARRSFEESTFRHSTPLSITIKWFESSMIYLNSVLTKLGAPDSSFRVFSLHPLQKSQNQKIRKSKNGASESISRDAAQLRYKSQNGK